MEIKRLNFWNMISGFKISAGQQAMSEWLNDSLVTLTDQTYSHSSTNSHLILKCKSNILSITSSNRNLHKKLHIHPQISRREFLLSYTGRGHHDLRPLLAGNRALWLQNPSLVIRLQRKSVLQPAIQASCS